MYIKACYEELTSKLVGLPIRFLLTLLYLGFVSSSAPKQAENALPILKIYNSIN
jgi:hypothetical protein